VTYVDDMAFVALDPETATRFIHQVRSLAPRFNFQLNLNKTVLVTSCPRAPSVALREFPDEPPTVTASAKHLGHPLVVPWDPRTATAKALEEMHPLLMKLFALPLPIRARLVAWNQLASPGLLYRLECLAPQETGANCVEWWEQEFLKGLTDLPLCTSGKTLYSEARCGLGLTHGRTAWAQRTLDTVSRALEPLKEPQGASNSFHRDYLLRVQHAAARSVGAYTDPTLPAGADADHPLRHCVVEQGPTQAQVVCGA
jgi:hypothetical protein